MQRPTGVDDALTDLDDRPGRVPGPDDPVAMALRRALDGDPRPREAALLAGVQARATRSHRRRLGVAGAAVAASVAAVALVAPAVVTGGPAPRAGRAAPALAGPAEPSPGAPTPTDDDGPMGRSLSLDEVQALLPGAPLVDVRTPAALQDDLAVDAGGALCTMDGVRYPSAPTSIGTALWGPGAAATASSTGSIQERLLGWDGAAGARAYVQAVAGTASGCQDAGPASTAVTGGHGGVIATTATGSGRWRVRVVAAVGGTALDVSADVAAGGASQARERVSALWRAAAGHVPVLSPDDQASAALQAALAARAATPTAVSSASFLTLHEVAAGLPGAGSLRGLPLRQEAVEEPQRTGMCDGAPTAGDPAPTELGAVSWSDGELARGGSLSSQMTEELTRWDGPGPALQDAAAAAASAQACAAASTAADAALSAGSPPSQQPGASAPSGYHLVTPPAGLGAHAVVTVSSAFPRGWDVRVHAVDGTAGLTVSALVIGGGAADADTTAARVADLAVTALHRATAAAAVPAPTPSMVTHGPDPRG